MKLKHLGQALSVVHPKIICRLYNQWTKQPPNPDAEVSPGMMSGFLIVRLLLGRVRLQSVEEFIELNWLTILSPDITDNVLLTLDDRYMAFDNLSLDTRPGTLFDAHTGTVVKLHDVTTPYYDTCYNVGRYHADLMKTIKQLEDSEATADAKSIAQPQTATAG